jgi:hypothetical protein
MPKILKRITDWVYQATASTKFFIATVGLLVFQSVWLAFTAIYPLPFDEFVHIGRIQMYARQWSPFITGQPLETSLYGDVTRTLSYLYHYLMSFPYRVLDTFTDSQMALVISLRLINIAMVVCALILFRKLFIMWRVPRRVMHVILLLFVVTPVVPFIAAHVNYDNLILLLMPTVLIFGTRLIIDKGDVAWNSTLYALFGLAGVITKETFLPLFAVISTYVGWRLWREHGMKFLRSYRQSFLRNVKQGSFIAALAGLLVVGGLVAERYGGNLVRYKSLIVDCDVVHPESFCEKNSVWYRNRENLRHKPADALYGNPLSYTQFWVSKTIRGFYVPFSHTPTQVIWDKEPFGPIVTRAVAPAGFLFGYVALAAGLVFVLLKRKDLWKDKPLRFALVICSGYLAILWIYNYSDYLRQGAPVAIQARYSYPILLLLFLLMVKSANDIISSKKIKAGLLVAAFALYVWGGGIVPWLIRADETWRWQNPITQSINQKVQTVLRYTVIH